jgi:hypothetical protein
MHRQLLAVTFGTPDGAGHAWREALAAVANGHAPPADACVAAREPGGALHVEPIAGMHAEGAPDAEWWHGFARRLAAGTAAEGLPAALAREVAAVLAAPGRSVLLVALPPGGDADGDRLAAALGRHGRVLRGGIEDAEGVTPPAEAGFRGHRAVFGSFP